MKRYILLLLAAPLTFSAPVIAQPATGQPVVAAASQDGLYKSIQANMRDKKYPEAVTQAEQALAINDLSVRDKVRFLNVAADASMRQSPAQYSQAKGFYEKIIADPVIANTDKINALRNLSDAYINTLAGQYLDQMDLSPANDALNRALQLPDLKPAEQAIALKNVGALYEREDNYDKAIATYQQIIALDVNGSTKTAAWKSIADAYSNSGQTDKAVAIYKQQGFDLIALYKRLGNTDQAVAEATKVLDDTAASDKDRWAAFTKLPYWGRVSTDYPAVLQKNAIGIRQVSEKYLSAFMETDPNRSLILLQKFRDIPVLRNDYYKGRLADPEFIAWAAPLLLKAPKLPDKDYVLVKTKYVDALAALNDIDQAAAEAQSVATDQRVDNPTHFWAQLVAASLASKDGNISKIIQQEKTLPDKDKAQSILDAAQTVLLAGNDQAARNLYSIYQGLFVHLPVATINCAFVPDAPFDVGSWLTSPLLTDAKTTAKLDRPYGDNLKFLLETDSSTSGRNAGSSSAEATGDTDTNLHIACDMQGIHIFFDAHDSHAQEVLDGLLRGGSFEMYLAPGKDQAYYTFLPNLTDGTVSTGPGAFITMYPNAGFRLPSTDDGTMRSVAHRTKDGFGLSMFFSWQLFYDKLPSNGTKWQFESIRWTRAGGLSFAGSQSVHNRSSWGDIVFSGLTPQNLNAIKRAIIFEAVAKYRDAKKITNPVGQWADPELGDPVFYQSKVAPLLARLDKYADRVNKDMTAVDVEEIYNEAVPDWMELNYRVAALRTQYLKGKFLAK